MEGLLVVHEKEAHDLRTSNRASTKPHLFLAQMCTLLKATIKHSKSSETLSVISQTSISLATPEPT